jgi:hypothetical protein
MKPSHLSCPFCGKYGLHLPWPVLSPDIIINTLAPEPSVLFVLIRLLLCNWLQTFSKQSVPISLSDVIQTQLLNKSMIKMARPWLKVKGKTLVIRHSICRCIHAVKRSLKRLITFFVLYERSWFVAIRILLRQLHTKTGLDWNCTLSDRGVREIPSGSRKCRTFLTFLHTRIPVDTQRAELVLHRAAASADRPQRSVATRTGYDRSTVPHACVCVCVCELNTYSHCSSNGKDTTYS